MEKGAHVDTTTDIIEIGVGIVHEGSIILLLVLIRIATIATAMTANMMVPGQPADHNGMTSMYSDLVCLASIASYTSYALKSRFSTFDASGGLFDCFCSKSGYF